ncbi:MAG: glycosyltransferase [Methylobacterium mesophilicum]|nr:glycosyltransferase [Methylobacterium mesophilicum]
MSKDPRPLVMVLNGACWPGNDASGPNQSLRALAAALKPLFRFHLVARDRPFGATQPEPRGANEPDFSDRTYCAPSRFGANALLGTLEAAKPSLIWLNGFHDREFTLPVLFARRLGRVRGIPVLLSPRGEFAPGALNLKRARKTAYRALARRAGLLEGVAIHATGEGEARDIQAGLPWHRRHVTAPNLAALPSLRDGQPRTPGEPLRIVFLGRIARVKNLDFALRVLATVRMPVRFHVAGPVQDESYWQECRTLIARLPAHVAVSVHGGLSHAASLDLLSRADLLFLPSRSENFGHAIFEALGCAVPALISDGTPWRGLEAARAGFDLPLSGVEPFAAVIDRFAALADPAPWRRGARLMAERHVARADAAETNAAMLHRLIGAAA